MVTERRRWRIDRSRNFEDSIDVSIYMLGGYSAGVIRHEERGMRGINGNFGAIDAALAGFFSENVEFS